MAKLITLEEAAHILGISAAEVGEMRQRQELYGYRDGGNWKFKQSDVEQLAMDRSGMAPSPGGSGILPVDLEGGDNDLVVLSEFELGDSGPGSSTVIGGKNKPGSDLSLGSDLKLDSGIDLAGGDSDLKLAGNSGLNLAGDSGPLSAADTSDKSNVLGGPDSDLGILGSDVRLAGDSNVFDSPLPGGSMAAGKTMLTAELAEKGGPAPSSVKMEMRDSESVFGDTGSDVTRNAGGSGINLLSPQDSGMLLDDLDLSGASGIAQGIGDDSEIKGDDDFLLTPSLDGGDDSMDSGSQVIALDGDYGDDATATLLAGDVPGLSAAFGDEGMMAQPGGMVGGGYATVPDTHFGVGTVAAMSVCVILMGLTGIMMYDIIRNMWAWDTPLSVSSTLMDMIPGVRN
ncbi:MAG: helix-turn-helix domain-containing protein [Planctomycetales bacterium]|nr:helix-turn-helix domain-containing protein [Planctomycetales bacterium]